MTCSVCLVSLFQNSSHGVNPSYTLSAADLSPRKRTTENSGVIISTSEGSYSKVNDLTCLNHSYDISKEVNMDTFSTQYGTDQVESGSRVLELKLVLDEVNR